MSGVNKAIILGRLGRDPELRTTQSGQSVCNFSVATSEKWKDKSTGDTQERTEWHNVVAWGKLAEICAEYLQKGREVYIEGKLQTSKYEKDGIERYKTEIVAQTVQFIGGQGSDTTKAQSAANIMGGKVVDDDIPF